MKKPAPTLIYIGHEQFEAVQKGNNMFLGQNNVMQSSKRLMIEKRQAKSPERATALT